MIPGGELRSHMPRSATKRLKKKKKKIVSKGKGPQEAPSTRNICIAAVKMVSPHFFSVWRLENIKVEREVEPQL